MKLAVIGAGPAALSAVHALRYSLTTDGVAGDGTAAGAFEPGRFELTCYGPPPRLSPDESDPRTTALMQSSVNLLSHIGVWDQVRPHAAPLDALRLIDDTGRLFRAPESLFEASEFFDHPFAFNLPNRELVRVLFEGLAQGGARGRVRFQSVTEVSRITPGPDRVEFDYEVPEAKDGGHQRHHGQADLVIGADGRGSPSRMAAGIRARETELDQAALVCNLDHSRPHENICTEFHRAEGPLTLVPLPGERSSLVWVARRATIAGLMALSDAAFIHELEARLYGVLGVVEGITRRGSFPLRQLKVDRYAQNRIALVGEAAHVLPPIGAQGLNLGFRDAAFLAGAIGASVTPGGAQPFDLAGFARRYNEARSHDVGRTMRAVEVLNQTLTSRFYPLHVLRGAGLHLINALPSMRQMLVQGGMGSNADACRLLSALG